MTQCVVVRHSSNRNGGKGEKGWPFNNICQVLQGQTVQHLRRHRRVNSQAGPPTPAQVFAKSGHSHPVVCQVLQRSSADLTHTTALRYVPSAALAALARRTLLYAPWLPSQKGMFCSQRSPVERAVQGGNGEAAKRELWSCKCSCRERAMVLRVQLASAHESRRLQAPSGCQAAGDQCICCG